MLLAVWINGIYMHYDPITAVTLLAGLWRKTANGKDMEKRVFCLPEDESEMALFKTKYNTTQKQLQAIAAMDDLLSGG